MMHGWFDGRPIVAFPNAESCCRLASTKLYYLVLKHMDVNKLLRVVTWQRPKQESNPRLLDCKSDTL